MCPSCYSLVWKQQSKCQCGNTKLRASKMCESCMKKTFLSKEERRRKKKERDYRRLHSLNKKCKMCGAKITDVSVMCQRCARVKYPIGSVCTMCGIVRTNIDHKKEAWVRGACRPCYQQFFKQESAAYSLNINQYESVSIEDALIELIDSKRS